MVFVLRHESLSFFFSFSLFFPQAMEDAVEKHRQLARQRLEARRRKREDQQYEEDMAASIVTMAEKQFALIREKTMMRRAGAKDTVTHDTFSVFGYNGLSICLKKEGNPHSEGRLTSSWDLFMIPDGDHFCPSGVPARKTTTR